jgi:outer membrane protein assembly factor BamB
VPCRDGRVYALPDTRESTQRARRVFVGGQAGHPSAIVVVSQDAFMIAGFDGQVNCVAISDWATRWTENHDTPVTAAAALPEGHVAIGDERGRVLVLDRSDGRVIARTEPSFPITHLAVRGDVLLVADRARRLRTLELPGLALIDERTLPAPIVAILPDGEPLLADGTRSAFEGDEPWPAPVTEVVERGGRVLYGTADGKWLEFDGKRAAATAAPGLLACAPLRHGEAVYVAGVDSKLHCTSPGGGLHWSVALSSPAVDLLATRDGFVLALLRNGQLVLVEGKP